MLSPDEIKSLVISRSNIAEVEGIAKKYVLATIGHSTNERVYALCLLLKALMFQNKIVIADVWHYLEEITCIVKQVTIENSIGEQALYIASVLYAASGNLDKSHDLAFELLDILTARYGEENVTGQIDMLINAINPFHEDSIASANPISFKVILSQSYRIAARLLCASGHYSVAKEYFELSLGYDPDYILTKYEYAVLLSREIYTRSKGAELLTVIGSSHNLQAYKYYSREYTKLLPRLMLALSNADSNVVSLYFLVHTFLAWIACKNRNNLDAAERESGLLQLEIGTRPTLSSPLIFSKISTRIARNKARAEKLSGALDAIEREVKFADVCFKFGPGGRITIKESTDREISRSALNRYIFNNKFGEAVVEVSGAASEDARQDKSWAFAYLDFNGHSDLHFHRERSEVYYVVNGTAKVIIDGEERIVKTGEEILIPAGGKHTVYSVDPMHKLAMMVKCEPSWSPVDFNLVSASEEDKHISASRPEV